jgi:hypothetical protein
MTIFYSLRFENPPTWRARSLYLYPPGTGWPSYTPRHWVLGTHSREERELLYDWRFTANQFFLAPSPLRLTAGLFSQMNTCVHRPYITSSLRRGWVCHLQLLLALASAFILGSESRGSRENILLPQIRDFPPCLLLRLAGLRWRYSTPSSTVLAKTSRNGPHRKHRTSIVAFVSVDAGTCLPRRCLETVAV